ncbi:putative hydrolase of the HAD superfamily [Streptacidiphilus sp. MAP12-20]|uniref:HAD family hydrolase n=1 Tax=Streptacidiphilus sp. MAP12-20 TaxID=3156299 RepID=UPI003515A060
MSTSMMRTGSGLILDFGGVLTTPIAHSITAFEESEGLTPGLYERLVHGTAPGRDLHYALERGEVSQADWNATIAQLLGVEPENLMGRTMAALKPSQPVIDAAQFLRARGVRVGILTNSTGLAPYNPYDGYELETRYDALVVSEREGLRKPDPEIYEVMLDRLGLPAASCVFVDDIDTNLDPARTLGMTTVLARDARQVVYDLESLFDIPLQS